MIPMLPLPAWPAFDAERPAIFYVTMVHIYNAFDAAHWPRTARIAALANADMESTYKPAAVDHHQYFNLWQWKWDPRGMRIRAAIGTDVRTERNVVNIVHALTWELVIVYPKTFNAVMQATSVAAATGTFCSGFEGAGAADAVQRRQLDGARIDSFISAHAAWVAAQGTGS
jgi:hypothetical protein